MSRFGVIPSVWRINGFFLDPLFSNQTEKSIIRERWSQETFWGKGQSSHLFFFMGKKVSVLVLLCYSCHERVSYLKIYPSSKYQKVKQVPSRAQNFSQSNSLNAQQCLTCRVARPSQHRYWTLTITRWWVTHDLQVMILSDNTAVHLILCQRGNFSLHRTDDHWIGRANSLGHCYQDPTDVHCKYNTWFLALRGYKLIPTGVGTVMKCAARFYE